MGPTQTARCQTCQAIVNPAWNTCAACHGPLTSSETVIEPAAPNARPIYWERSSGEIVGPAKPEFFAKVGTGTRDQDYWVIAHYQGVTVWLRSDRLRSKQQFAAQRKPQAVELVKGFK